jgi:hypothetical protein
VVAGSHAVSAKTHDRAENAQVEQDQVSDELPADLVEAEAFRPEVPDQVRRQDERRKRAHPQTDPVGERIADEAAREAQGLAASCGLPAAGVPGAAGSLGVP